MFTLVICVSHRKYRLKETEGPTQATESVGSRMDSDPVPALGSSQSTGRPRGVESTSFNSGPPSTEHREEAVTQS